MIKKTILFSAFVLLILFSSNAFANLVSVFGTEYNPNDNATIYAQVSDNQGLPINDANCSLDIYEPNGTYVEDQPMINSGRDDGIYLLNMIAFPTQGVYLLPVKCNTGDRVPVWIYPPQSHFSPLFNPVAGTWEGNSTALDDKADRLYMSCSATGGVGCIANFSWDIKGFTPDNLSNLDLHWSGQSLQTPNVTFSYWNGTSFILLNQSMIITATALSGSSTSNIDWFMEVTLPQSAVINNTILIQQNAKAGGTLNFFDNWLALNLIGAVGTVFGSAEMHITNTTATIVVNRINALDNNMQGNFTAANTTAMTNFNNLSSVQIAANNTRNAYFNNLSGQLALLNTTSGTILAQIIAVNGNVSYLTSISSGNFTAIFTAINGTNALINFTQGNLTLQLLAANNTAMANFNNLSALQTYQTQVVFGNLSFFKQSAVSLNATANAINSTVFQLNASVGTLQSTTNNLVGNLTNINGNLSDISTSIAIINANLTNLANLTAIQQQLNDMTEQLTFVVRDMNAKVDWIYRYLRDEEASLSTRIRRQFLGG